MKALGIELSKTNVFNRNINQKYYFINHIGNINTLQDTDFFVDKNLYNVANYCTEKALMEQRALHETLNRLLWRFSLEHDGDKIDWNDSNTHKHHILYNHSDKKFVTEWKYVCNPGSVCFHTYEIAQQAIEKVIKPFIAEHPDFRW